MSSPGSFVAAHAVTAEDFKDFSCSLRTKPIDYAALKKVFNALVGGETNATAYAIKLCLHGCRVKEGDYVQIKGQKLTFKYLIEQLKTQEDYKDEGTSQGKEVNKEIVTIRRICRVYAANVSHLISKNMIKVPADLLKFAKDTGLPEKFCFLDSCYGMTRQDLIDHGAGFILFCENFDVAIQEAYTKGWISGASARSHAEAARNYLKWRGLELADAEA